MAAATQSNTPLTLQAEMPSGINKCLLLSKILISMILPNDTNLIFGVTPFYIAQLFGGTTPSVRPSTTSGADQLIAPPPWWCQAVSPQSAPVVQPGQCMQIRPMRCRIPHTTRIIISSFLRVGVGHEAREERLLGSSQVAKGCKW